ncbi:MAG: DUF1931 domain-containing protein [Candidatus Aenigmarchaeota archaeon]|nr:DUF1931 domain-containing protein [Candidatus Aenigmarchaeota archaeon]
MALVVASKIKESIRKNKMNTASDFIPALEKHLTEEINKACRRCSGNGRKTVRAADL